MPLLPFFVIGFIALIVALMFGLAGSIPMPGASPVAFAQADIARSWAAAEIDMTVNRHVLIMEQARKAAEIEAAAKIAQANADAQTQMVWAQASANIAVILIGGIVAIIVIAALIVMMRQAAQARRIIEDLRQQQIEAIDGGYRLDGREWIVKSTNKELEYRR